uniref:Uncharacterized protein n=1 Tax=Utricularia reniformis TaxID=192314 RepID=A0A1Y0B2Z7_9LAMI|nr:hypothetical protein AEK19_MT1530 [Utricularia reniformis]ART31719.1 hypothetical protein AEK19_MT1530 [Utricularia reniformis]
MSDDATRFVLFINRIFHMRYAALGWSSLLNSDGNISFLRSIQSVLPRARHQFMW